MNSFQGKKANRFFVSLLMFSSCVWSRRGIVSKNQILVLTGNDTKVIKTSLRITASNLALMLCKDSAAAM